MLYEDMLSDPIISFYAEDAMQLSSVVLIVEDNPDILSLAVDILETGGYSVIQASNGEQALACLKAGEPTLVLLDLEMPVMSGWTFMERLQENDDPIPVIIMSAQNYIARRAVMDGSAVDYVEKPFDIDDLLLKVSKYHL